MIVEKPKPRLLLRSSEKRRETSLLLRFSRMKTKTVRKGETRQSKARQVFLTYRRQSPEPSARKVEKDSDKIIFEIR